MFGTNNKNENKSQKELLTVISEITKLDGNFSSDSDTVIDGSVDGELNINGKLTIGENATIKASIKVEELLVEGEVVGNIESIGNVTIMKSGKVTGDIILGGDLIIEPGAIFVGSSKMEEKLIADDAMDDMDLTDDDLDLE